MLHETHNTSSSSCLQGIKLTLGAVSIQNTSDLLYGSPSLKAGEIIDTIVLNRCHSCNFRDTTAFNSHKHTAL